MKIQFSNNNENKSPEAKKARTVKLMVFITLILILFVLISLVINVVMNKKKGGSSSSEPPITEVGKGLYDKLTTAISDTYKPDKVEEVKTISSVNEFDSNLVVSYIDSKNIYNDIIFYSSSVAELEAGVDLTKKANLFKTYSTNFVDSSLLPPNVVKSGGFVNNDNGHLSYIARVNNSFISTYSVTYNPSSKVKVSEGKTNEVNTDNKPYFALLSYIATI